MKTAKHLTSTYHFNKGFKWYTISDQNGRDLIYYNKDRRPFYEFGYPYMISVNVAVFNDPYMTYLYNRLIYDEMTEEKIEFYLMKLLNRMLCHELAKDFLIGETLLNKNGKYIEALHRYALREYDKIYYHKNLHFKTDTPYSTEVNASYFDFTNKELIRQDIQKDCIEIDRHDFELALINVALKQAYVEAYDPQSKFYFGVNTSVLEDEKFFSGIYLMLKDGRLQFFFFEDEVPKKI